MKLIFLCTSLAPGRDGVGDYVRQLADACTRRGHVCLLVAVHDRHLGPTMFLQQANEVRLSCKLSWKRRTALLTDLIQDYDPHWISWQLVPFGFHAKGVMPSRTLLLADAVRERRNQVMMHELWLGLGQGTRLRQRLLGTLQRRRLIAFLGRLGPRTLHTTNGVYQHALARQGWPSEILPLFGNIPIASTTPREAHAELAALVGGSEAPDHSLIGVLFGTIHPQWQPETTCEWLRAASLAIGRPIRLLALGRAGGHGSRVLTQLARGHRGLRITHAGALPPDRISRVLQVADFGLATHPWALIEKSGSTATLLEHGLPVLVPRDDWQPVEGPIDSPRDPLLRLLSTLEPADFRRWLAGKRAPGSLLSEVADRFLSDIDAAIPGGALVA